MLRKQMMKNKFEEEIEKHYDNLTTSAIQIIELHKKVVKEKEELEGRINEAIKHIEKGIYSVDGSVVLETLKGGH